jgi:solute carrier family 4 anion exchanger 2
VEDLEISIREDSLKECLMEESEELLGPQPNTALLSFILMFGTFLIAYFLRNFRNSQFLGRTIRRALGDFGVPIAIVLMVVVDFSFGDTYTEKLTVPEGISVTNSSARGWLINPTGTVEAPLALWAYFAAFLPAILLYMLLFMETHICELIMMEKTKEAKGGGLHLDIVLLSLINLICGFFGGPWICAATVRAVSHVSALTVMSTSNVPGETPKVVGVRDQRVSHVAVSLLLGLSILMAPILKLVPFAVLFGVFLYMGVSGMNGVQFFDRLILFVKPVKHHPNVSYVKRVTTWRMVLFTIFQLAGLVLLWVVKSTSAALAFPFFVMLMIPYRFLLKYIFTDGELEALDGATAGKDLSGEEDDETDFYVTANECPITPATTAPLHRSVMALMAVPTMIGTKGIGAENKNFEKDPAFKA